MDGEDVSIYEEHSENYKLYELYIEERVEELMEYGNAEIVKLAEKILQDECSEYILEEFDLVSRIIDYYDRHKKLSVKQKLYLCRAIAEVEHHYHETY